MNNRIHLDSDGNTQIFARDLGNIVAAITEYKKLGLQNAGDIATGLVQGKITQYASSEGYTLAKWALCLNTLSCPFSLTIELLNGGALVAGTKYYYRITAFNELGETGGSLEVWALTDSTKKSIKLTWDKVEGSDGYIIYRSTNQDYTNSRRDIIENPNILEWTDTGQASDPSSPYGWPGINTDFNLPSENTTAGEAPNYGTPPALDTKDLTFGIIQPGEQKFYWIGIVTTLSTTEGIKNLILDFPET